jgi:hypothetical protein
MALPPEGLDLSRPDEITEEEIDAFHAAYERTGKGRLDSFEFWIEFRPDVLKRHKARTPHYFGKEGKEHPLPLQLASLHQYTIESFEDGIGYEIRNSRSSGARLSDILDTLSIAWLSSGHAGMYAMSRSAGEYLRSYPEPEIEPRFPPTWGFDPEALRCGMDFANDDTSSAEIGKLLEWYERTVGFVPRNVSFLAKHRPGLLKAYRARYEHAIRDTLPVQMMPFLLLNHAVVQGWGESMRENWLLGRALGVSDEQLQDAIFLGVLFAGASVLDLVDEAIGDLIGT